jgi:3-phenylpropionate/trans-cinnamate dioxygenase ferredoxin subunit
MELDGTMVAIVNAGGTLFAIGDRCTHDGSPLFGCGLDAAELLDGGQVVCPRHGARFCLRTGAALTPPAHEPLAVYAMREESGRLLVALP